MADLIVLAGSVGIETAAKNAGIKAKVPFTAGRSDATQEQTDVASFAVLEPLADGFRNYAHSSIEQLAEISLVDKAALLSLTPPEMTVLVGGLRVLGTNFDGSKTGVLTTKKGSLTNDFFKNILEMKYMWSPSKSNENLFEARENKNTKNSKPVWAASRPDLVFGSHSELRALSEVYGSDDGEKKFVSDFIKAWSKVMDLDRFDIKKR